MGVGVKGVKNSEGIIYKFDRKWALGVGKNDGDRG